MTALAIADLHLSEKQRDEYRFAVMERIATLIEKHKVSTLLILGDLTESKDYHPATLVNDVVDIIYSFSCLADVIILTGNHDYTQTDCPFFHFLRRFKRVRWINTPQKLELDIGSCLFLPHTRDWETNWGDFLNLECDWVFAHNTFEGAETEHGKKLSGIPTDIFPKGIPVISGDIHTPQELGPVTYVGSPYCVDFGDSFEPRALLLKRKTTASIPLPGPQKRLIELADGYSLANIKAKKGDIVKVRYSLTPEEQPDWFAIKTRIKEQLMEKGIEVHLVQPEMSQIAAKRVAIKKAPLKSDEHIVQEFGTQKKLLKPTLAIGMELLATG